MSMNPFQTIEATFGWREFPDAMFYRSQFGLRFELGGDIDSVPIRFMTGLERAKAVAGELFSTSSTLTAVVSIYGEERATRRHSASMQQLMRIGFPHSFGPAIKIPQNDEDHIAEFGGDLFRHWYAVQFTNDEASISALLWASVSREMAIQPKVRWVDTIHIADIQKRLALTAYDDRGMDVVGPSAPALSTLYQKFNPWLLDYDRAEMDAKFSR
ncbi:DUF3885 domain-containing protein [Sphingomonas sp. R647]|uniref:DUF3885 domain-containing protein n=1 Tax=Sphingomonas sp. R647 TaxID=2875233 RepID=UPI001CD6E9DE|nr:DUF3885 domain-containing protein [Sphingomonas sp. R647]MCA1196726.1 DUF3885 domain-containing protein [Sphingomonas sp. R647]